MTPDSRRGLTGGRVRSVAATVRKGSVRVAVGEVYDLGSRVKLGGRRCLGRKVGRWRRQAVIDCRVGRGKHDDGIRRGGLAGLGWMSSGEAVSTGRG